ncbi:MAG TPA: hypothetical protein VLA87_12185 [Gaiellaceae bacterium]|nr:hypothetical protein [Gaiellaceae bacterium]
MRTRFGGAGPLVVVAVLAAVVALGPAAEQANAVKLTFIGDSKAAAINYSRKAKRLLSRGHDVRRDLRVCRRLVAPSCAYPPGVYPRSTLETIRHYGTDLGTVLVVDVGYNDSSTTYRRHLDRVMRAAIDRGVEGVVWVNLSTPRADYRRINRIIRQARERHPRLYLANWNRYSRGHTGWFSESHGDGIHLDAPGAVALVKLVRRYIPLAAEGPRETAAGQTAAPSEPEATETAETATETTAAELTGNSPPVGSNLGGGDGGSLGLSGILPFAAGTALMLFLVFVTLKRRGAAPR